MISKELDFSLKIFEKCSNITFHDFRLVEAEMLQSEREMRRTNSLNS